MARLTIREINYSGDNFSYKSKRLEDGLVIFEGENGSGKTTLCSLIYYALGGSVDIFNSNAKEKHTQVTGDTNNFIELAVEINSKSFQFRRHISENEINITDEKELVGVFQLFRQATKDSDQKDIFSDWFLKELGIGVPKIHFQNYSGYINIKDLMRLIYHDQSQDPGKIYKELDSASWVSDSKPFRKAIFEILMGQTFEEFYKELNRLKSLESERSEIQDKINSFKLAANELMEVEDKNINFLQKEVDDISLQLERLELNRIALKKAGIEKKPEGYSAEEEMAGRIDEKRYEINLLKEKIGELSREESKYVELKSSVITEVTQIKKIIFAHQQLKLFSPDTCPYCLNKVERNHNHCICGADIKESDYERFFYSDKEYSDIYKSKQKNVQTINHALDSVAQAIAEEKRLLAAKVSELDAMETKLTKYLNERVIGIDTSKLSEFDDKLLEVKSKRDDLENHLKIEQKRQTYEDRVNTLEVNIESLKKSFKSDRGQSAW